MPKNLGTTQEVFFPLIRTGDPPLPAALDYRGYRRGLRRDGQRGADASALIALALALIASVAKVDEDSSRRLARHHSSRHQQRLLPPPHPRLAGTLEVLECGRSTLDCLAFNISP
jgi:hypothetical protein